MPPIWLSATSTGRRPDPKAENSFKRALDIDPRNALTNRVFASFYLGTKRVAEAEQPLQIVADVTKSPDALFALSWYYISTKNDAAARRLLSPMSADPKTASTANVWLAALDYKDGHSQNALKRVADVLAADQNNLQALLLKSAVLLTDGKLDDALKSADAATGHYPKSTSAMFMLGRVQTARKQPEAAIHAFEETLRLNPRATAAKVALARLYLAQGQPEHSVGLAAEALANEPTNGEAQLVYARGLLRQGETDRASAELKQLSARFPSSADVHAEMGMLLGQKHDRDAARAEFQRALQLQPNHLEALGGLVALDLASNNSAAARALVDARVAGAPTAPLLALAAHTYAAGGDLQGAERLLRKALELDTSYLAAYRSLGQLYFRQNQLTEARAEFQKVAEQSPKSVGALTMIAIIDQAQGNLKAAQSGFEHVVQVDPEAAVAANNLAWIYVENGGNLDVALQLAQTARRHLPAVAEVNDTLGFIYYKKDLPALAVPALKVSVEKEPANAVYHYHLGLGVQQRGRCAAGEAVARAGAGTQIRLHRRAGGQKAADVAAAMSDLFFRAFSQGLQAFVPVACCVAWARRINDRDQISGAYFGLLASLPIGAAAGYMFQSSVHQGLWEALLAALALAPVIWFTLAIWRDPPIRSAVPSRTPAVTRVVFSIAAALIVVRQLMLIVAVLAAALDLGSLDATRAVCGGAGAALIVAALWGPAARGRSRRTLLNASRACAVVFLGEVAIYAFHKASEARLLPWSDVLESATEPYGPDGVYGLYISYLLIVAPIAAGVLTMISERRGTHTEKAHGYSFRRWTLAGAAILGIALAASIAVGRMHRGETVPVANAPADAAPATAAEISAIVATPHLLFRHLRMDHDYGRLAVTSLGAPGAKRPTVGFECDRVSFSSGVGICLQSERKMFSTYRAVFFDGALHQHQTLKLAGRPSRTRISADGRVGTITVFVTGEGHGYIGGSFSTKTTLVDMSAGEFLGGDLETFTTWRDGARFQAADFNFWGVTFTHDSNVFYATLKTGLKTYLVRGDLGLRKLTVLRENVECPSLSPDNRLIAFKKRVGPDMNPWRFYVLDLATMAERPITAETRSVDDQIEWLDDTHVLYGVPRAKQPAIRDIWVSPVDDSAPARVFLPEAESPIVVR